MLLWLDEGIPIRRTSQPSPSTRQQILSLFEQLRQEISTLEASQALPGTEENVRATLMGTTAVLWADLEDIRPRTLNRYGAVDPTLEETIGPPIERLIQGVLVYRWGRSKAHCKTFLHQCEHNTARARDTSSVEGFWRGSSTSADRLSR